MEATWQPPKFQSVHLYCQLRLFSVPLFHWKVLEHSKVVFEATVRQYNFASILSVLGRFVKVSDFKVRLIHTFL